MLGEILGLSLYDEYEERAKVRARKKGRQVAELDGLLQEMDRELAREPEYEAQLAGAQARVSELSESVKEAEEVLRDLRSQHSGKRPALSAGHESRVDHRRVWDAASECQ